MSKVRDSGKGTAGQSQPGARAAYSSAIARWHAHGHYGSMRVLGMCMGMGSAGLMAVTSLCYAYDLVGSTDYQEHSRAHASYTSTQE